MNCYIYVVNRGIDKNTGMEFDMDTDMDMDTGIGTAQG